MMSSYELSQVMPLFTTGHGMYLINQRAEFTKEEHCPICLIFMFQEAEMALMSFSLTASRKLAMEFSPPVEYSSVSNMVVSHCLSSYYLEHV